MSFELFEEYSLVLGIGGLILFMIFIVWNLAKESKAGRFGTFILFIALGLGLLGFVVKTVLVEVMGLGGQ
ncbi:DUF2788 domain-containing protein [Microbulbifer harenosus]|uniref:DUF2788 domain-containing protein n=1 Tax=Microbulbifer harenosus TaxID=2576840 RepID=A0ABY2UG27_9GAMM|nr:MULTISPECIES: DUF2788 domain-containing protein [Microbulbifer]QIL89234.1 DUF2788 domain-containing protein [Microbulbifer sp. SH-1]TLM76462.1 DUF2788 domain-containing protein [Microbulbifer harenosus]